MEMIGTYPVAAWATLGVVLLIVEILSVTGFFVSFAAAAFLVALALLMSIAPGTLLLQALLFCVLGVALILPFRWLLRRYADRTPDINQY